MYKYKKELNIVGNEFTYYTILKRKRFLFIPYWSKKVFSNDGLIRMCFAKTEKEAKDLIKLLN